MCRRVFGVLKKYSVVVSIITGAVIIFFLPQATPAYAATMSWSTATVGSVTASSTRVLWDYVGSRYALGYVTSDGTTLKFATSTEGSSWSSSVTVLSTTNLVVSDVFFTTSSAANGEYVFLGMPNGANKRFLDSASGGSTWTNTQLATMDHYQNGNVQTTVSGHTYVAGRVQIGSTDFVVSATTTANGRSDVFASSTAASPSVSPTVDFAYFPGTGVAAYTFFGSGDMGVVTSTNMYSWTSYGFTPPGSYGVLMRPRVKFDKNGTFYILYMAANNITCSTGCDILLSRYSAGSWTTEVIDTVGASGAVSFDAQHDLAFINGTTPIITYYNKNTGYLRYAIKDSGASGCSGTDAASWTCGNVVALTMAPNVSIATNNSTGAVIVYQDGLSTLKSAYGTYSSSSSSSATLTAFPKPTIPTDVKLIVNGGHATTKKLEIDVLVSANNATEVALSTNPNFYNVPWQRIEGVKKITLQSGAETQYVYAKVTNASGGISETVFGAVTYLPPTIPSPITTIPVPSVVVLPQPQQLPQSPPASSGGIINDGYKYFVIDDGVNPFAAESAPLGSGTIITVEKPLCPERANAFSLGGPIVRNSKGAMYMVLKSQGVVCPVLSMGVVRSWGARVERGEVGAYRVSSVLPYRPGTIVQNSKTYERYFVNSKGKMQKFPSVQQYIKLGYRKNRIVHDASRVVAQYPKTVSLTRTDIHPDGTLFALNSKQGRYAILQNRVLHPIDYKTLVKFKEIVSRAVSLLPSEQYPIGVSWN